MAFDPLQGLYDVIPGVTNLDDASNYVTRSKIQGGTQGLIKGLIDAQQMSSPVTGTLSTLGQAGLGYLGGEKKAQSDLLDFAAKRQDLIKSGLDIKKTPFDIKKLMLDIESGEFDLRQKQNKDAALFKLIQGLSPEEQLLAINNPAEFSKNLIGNSSYTTSYKDYLFAKKDGFKGSYTDYTKEVEKYRAANYSATLKMPEKEKMILETDLKLLTQANEEAMSAKNIEQSTKEIVNLLGDLEGGGFAQKAAQIGQFFGIDSANVNANAVVEAVRTRSAPLMRATGSGSTSDMEFKAYMNSFPSLALTVKGRKVMQLMAEALSERKAKLADYTRTLVNSPEGFSFSKLREYDDSLGSMFTQEMRNVLDAERGKKGLPPLAQTFRDSINIIRKKEEN
jgi:hypothetical protein